MSEYTYEALEAELRSYLPKEAVDQVRRAYQFAERAHSGQVRKSGAPYITHPLEVAHIVADFQQDPTTIIAALLHDTVEDCGLEADDIRREFGDDIAFLVEGVTKLGRIQFVSSEEAQAENLRKMIIAMAEDLRVVIVKLADRLHNMRTLKYLSANKKIEISIETREIFSPLAHRLGMWGLKWELEDLAFFYLQPEEFQAIKRMVSDTRQSREHYVESFRTHVHQLLDQAGIRSEVKGRPKHFYSIYRKLIKQDLSYDELYDVLGLRVLVDSVQDCYGAMGVIHSACKPINGRIKDYVAMPKSNMYQSLHTTVIGPEGKPVEIQIRTHDMHEVAEMGIAAHWRYKEGRSQRGKFDGDMSWLRQMIDTQDEVSGAKDYLQNLKVDLFMDEVFVFTPKGDVQVLAKGATPVDFAYKVHTEIGHRCIGAKVNSRIVPLNYVLRNGERVEIMTSNVPNPKVDWLNFARTGHAKTKIKYWFRKQNSQENIEKGKTELEKVVLISGLTPSEVLDEAIMGEFLTKYGLKKLDELYLNIAQGEMSAKSVSRYLEGLFEPESPEPDKDVLQALGTSKSATSSTSNIVVFGERNIDVHLAKCCHPLPGDSIVGFVTMGHGVSAHRTDCMNVLKLNERDQSRLIPIDWEGGSTKTGVYPVTIRIEAFDRIGLLKDIIANISEARTNIQEVRSQSPKKGGSMSADIVVEVGDLEQLNHIKQLLMRMPDIYSVSRETA